MVGMGVACKNSGNANTVKPATDTFIRDIPEERLSPSFIEMAEKERSLSGEESLENGFDEVQIRIAFSNSFGSEQVFRLIKKNDAWRGELDSLTFNYNENGGGLKSIDKVRNKIEPIFGWDKFVDSLMSLKIFSLPDMTLLPGYQIGSDGLAVTIETATPHSYRIYTYVNVNTYKDMFWQANNVSRIVHLVNTDLRVVARQK